MNGGNSVSNGQGMAGVGGVGGAAGGADAAHNPLALDSAIDLSPADAAALDTLVESGWNPAAVHDANGPRAARLLALLDATIGAPPAAAGGEPRDAASLEDVVLLRVARLRASGVPAQAPAPCELSAADVAALDALVESGMNPDALSPELAPRGRRQITLLSMLDTSPLQERDARIERTLTAVQRAIDAETDRFVLPETAPRGRRLHFADLVSIAALLLIGTALLFPIASGVREYGRRAACQSGMITAGLGFGQYAADSRDLLPMASPSHGGSPWWEVGRAPERSNSANLFTLVRTKYTKVGDLACPGNPSACLTQDAAGDMDWRRFQDVSYSYRNLFGRKALTIVDSPAGVLLADRSTLVLRAPGVLQVRPFDNSPNHGGRGQFVLVGDGSVRWLISPVLGDGDNLWLPRPLEDAIARLRGQTPEPDLTGTETPGHDADEFVAP